VCKEEEEEKWAEEIQRIEWPPHSTLHVLRRAFDRTFGDAVQSSHIPTTNNVTPTHYPTERRIRGDLPNDI